MTIKTFVVNPFQQNTYLVYDETKEAILIDCGCFSIQEKNDLIGYIESNGLSLKRLINTHLHLDHQFGNRFITEKFSLQPEANQLDEFLLKSIPSQASNFGMIAEEGAQLGAYLEEGDMIEFGNTTLKVLHVPGHSPGHVVFYSEKEGVLFAGDVIFRGAIGRTDLPKGDYTTLIKSITEKLLVLPENTQIYSGHGPSTTIGFEKQNNPHL
jgi:glyoxylase-like metal-dependent hydrolase (beta-lactamase superfamily II)